MPTVPFHTRPPLEPGTVHWYSPPEGWVLLPAAEAAERVTRNEAAFVARARQAQADRLATTRPTGWPAKHRELLDLLRYRAQSYGLRWSWNRSKKHVVAGVQPGGLLLLGADGTELDEYSSLDEAAADLIGTPAPATKKIGKAQLVAFLRSIAHELPDERAAEAHRLLEAA